MAIIRTLYRQTLSIASLASCFSLFFYSYPLLAATQRLSSHKSKLFYQQENLLKCGYKKKEINLKFPVLNISGKLEQQGNRVGDVDARCGEYQPPIPLTALMPASNIGTTIAEHPTLLFYVPDADLEGVQGELVIYKDKQTKLYNKTVPVKASDSIISIEIADLPSPLEVGKSYFWEFNLILDGMDRGQDVVVSGWIKRIAPNSTLKHKIDSSLPQQQPVIYATNGIWYEAVNSLAKLHCSSPDDSTITSNWKSLLQQVGLPEISSKPLAQCNYASNR